MTSCSRVWILFWVHHSIGLSWGEIEVIWVIFWTQNYLVKCFFFLLMLIFQSAEKQTIKPNINCHLNATLLFPPPDESICFFNFLSVHVTLPPTLLASFISRSISVLFLDSFLSFFPIPQIASHLYSVVLHATIWTDGSHSASWIMHKNVLTCRMKNVKKM